MENESRTNQIQHSLFGDNFCSDANYLHSIIDNSRESRDKRILSDKIFMVGNFQCRCFVFFDMLHLGERTIDSTHSCACKFRRIQNNSLDLVEICLNDNFFSNDFIVGDNFKNSSHSSSACNNDRIFNESNNRDVLFFSNSCTIRGLHIRVDSSDAVIQHSLVNFLLDIKNRFESKQIYLPRLDACNSFYKFSRLRINHSRIRNGAHPSLSGQHRSISFSDGVYVCAVIDLRSNRIIFSISALDSQRTFHTWICSCIFNRGNLNNGFNCNIIDANNLLQIKTIQKEI